MGHGRNRRKPYVEQKVKMQEVWKAKEIEKRYKKSLEEARGSDLNDVELADFLIPEEVENNAIVDIIIENGNKTTSKDPISSISEKPIKKKKRAKKTKKQKNLKKKKLKEKADKKREEYKKKRIEVIENKKKNKKKKIKNRSNLVNSNNMEMD
eukprot:TRINITY_DN172_c1_g1_i1.p1 TRINITY_DN172_c1_g1~~TRINITY_DN172_c1_g1_i1.p1  ORF type:complete len:153 (+),score=59.20 TRINITY_DN172_c1_g1_i1:59-517(+)